MNRRWLVFGVFCALASVPACQTTPSAVASRLPDSVLQTDRNGKPIPTPGADGTLPVTNTLAGDQRSTTNSQSALSSPTAPRETVLAGSATSLPSNAELPRRTIMPEEPSMPSLERAPAMSKLGSHVDGTISRASLEISDRDDKIARLAMEAERLGPEKAKEFLADIRRATANGQLPETLAVWQKTLELETRQQIPLARKYAQGMTGSNDDDRFPIKRVSANDEDRPLSSNAENSGGPIRLRYSANKLKSDDSSSANESTLRVDGKDWRKSLLKIAQNMEDAPSSGEGDLLEQTVASRLLYVMAGDSKEGLKPIAGGEDLDRKYWRNMLWALTRSFEDGKQKTKEKRAQETLTALDEAQSALRSQAGLTISTPILCKDVFSFAHYNEFDRYDFSAGQGLVAYWELQNFESVEDGEGFRTKTRATLEIQDANGRRRHQSEHEFKDDVSRTRRHDFFCAVAFHLPADLTPGEYTLKITATDKTSQKSAHRSVKLLVK